MWLVYRHTRWKPCENMQGVWRRRAKYRVKSCEFYFKDHRNKKAKKLNPESAMEFKELCDDPLKSATEEHYELVKKRFDEFRSGKEDRKFLHTWLSWRDARRGLNSRASGQHQTPFMIQADVIHAGWAHRDQSCHHSMLFMQMFKTR